MTLCEVHIGSRTGHETIMDIFIQGLKFTKHKGGPGSGHHGHGGRPGQVGGSAPGGAGVQIDPRFSERLGWSRMAIDDALASSDKEHLKGIKEISADPPLGYKTWDDYVLFQYGEETHAVAVYDKFSKVIHVNEDFIPQIDQALIHEIGHHISWYNGPKRSKVLSSKILIKDTRDRGLVSEVWTNEKWRTLHDVGPIKLSSMGLRKYSGYSQGEFAADSYVVWRLGSAQQKVNLAKFLGYTDLKEVFEG